QIGATWQGPDSLCDACPSVGACCQGGSFCSIGLQAGCEAEGHTWLGAGTTCSECPALPQCPEDGTLFGQRPADPLDEPSAHTSDGDAILTVFDNFAGVGGAVQEVTWWGLDLRRVGNMFQECDDTGDSFVISFWK